jgi:hypothetical protein
MEDSNDPPSESIKEPFRINPEITRACSLPGLDEIEAIIVRVQPQTSVWDGCVRSFRSLMLNIIGSVIASMIVAGGAGYAGFQIGQSEKAQSIMQQQPQSQQCAGPSRGER